MRRRIGHHLQTTQYANIAHLGVNSQTWDNIYVAKPLRRLSFRCAPIHETRRTDSDFGPTLASEKLAEEHGLTISRETLRKWISAADLSRMHELLPWEWKAQTAAAILAVA